MAQKTTPKEILGIPPAISATGKIEEKKHRITLFKDVGLSLPDLYFDVFILGTPEEEKQFAELFSRAHCKRAKSFEEADLVVFTGGSDVNPELYGEVKHERTKFSQERDDTDLMAYMYCMERGIPMLGICRGAQFLHVMNGGKLWQHVTGHYGDHPMYDTVAKRQIACVSSVHHQSIIHDKDNKDIEILGTAYKSTERWANPLEKNPGAIGVNAGAVGNNSADIEAFFYRNTCCLGIQGHPEYRGYNEFAQWTLKTIHNYINMNPDLTLQTGVKRMKEDLLKQRQFGFNSTVTIPETVENK